MSGARPEADFALPGLWPTREQLLVLKAALWKGDEARAAFQEWVALIDLEKDFDQGTYRLLPLLYDNLRRMGVEHPLMSRLKGIYRLTWYKNNKLFNDVRPVLQALLAAGVPTVLLKGVPLVFQYYRNVALRPMADVDILVPTAMTQKAIETMTRFPYTMYAPPTTDYLTYRHAMQYWSKDAGEIDLHWHALYECCEKGADDVFWKTARPLDFNGIATLAPNPTQMLFHTLIHGFRWNPEPPIRWIPDAVVILEVAGDEIDWNAIVEQARKHQLGDRLRLPLWFLKQSLAVPIPDLVLSQLEWQGTSLVQRIENTCVLRDPTRLHQSPLGHLWILFANYCRFARNKKPFEFWVGFTHYLRFGWNLRGRSEIVGYVFRGVSARVTRWFHPAAQASIKERPADPWT